MSQSALNNQTYDADFIANRQAASAGTSCALAAVHNDAVNSGSTAEVVARSQSASGADAYHVSALASTRAWCHGIDASDSGALKETTDPSGSTSPSSGTLTRKVTTAGEQTMPLQPAFRAYANIQNNVTGNSTVYTVLFANEEYDQNADFSSPIFTAPVTGIYRFDATINFSGIVLCTNLLVYMTVNGATNHFLSQLSPATIAVTGEYIVSAGMELNLTAGDTIEVRVIGGGEGADVIDINGGPDRSVFSGHLIC